MAHREEIIEIELRAPETFASSMRAIGSTAAGLAVIAGMLSEVAEEHASEEDPDRDRLSWLWLLLQQTLKDEIELFMAAHERVAEIVAVFNRGLDPVAELLKSERGRDDAGPPPQTEWREPSPYGLTATSTDPRTVAQAGIELNRSVVGVVDALVAKDPAFGTAEAQVLAQLAQAVEHYETRVFPMGVPRETSEPVEATKEQDELELGHA